MDHQATFPEITQVIQKARPLVFNFSYPIFDENYRTTLEEKILLVYYQREICCVPFSKFQLYLWQKLQRIMPYYNQLYYSETLKFNPLWDTDYNRTYNRKNDENRKQTENTTNEATTKASETDHTTSDRQVDQTSDTSNTTTQNSTAKTTTKTSDTPQGTIDNLESGKYMSSANIDDQDITNTTKDDGKATSNQTDTDTTDSNRDSNSTTNSTGTRTGTATANNIEDYIESVGGKRGGQSYASLLTEYREALLNIDDMIINDLNECFFMLY